jgi:choline dehydrogenase-like flavoprotein
MSDPAFAADALKGWDEIPARGPYTLAMGNSAVYCSLPNVTSDADKIISKIKGMVDDGSFATYLPSTAAPEVVAGYKHQLGVLAEALANPAQPVLESPFAAGPAGGAFHLKPLSRGTVLLDPSDPDGDPILDYRTATNPIDLDIMVEFVKYFRRYYQTDYLKKYGVVEVSPGPRAASDAQIRDWLRGSITMSFMHPCCTASMMPKEYGGVVGPDLKIHGLDGLRVADLSIVPLLIGSHTSATAYAIGEKVRDRKWRQLAIAMLTLHSSQAADIIIKQWSKA